MAFLFLFQTLSTLYNLDTSNINPFILFTVFACIILIPIGIGVILYLLIKKFKKEDPLKNIHIKWALLVGFTFYYSFLILKAIIDSDSSQSFKTMEIINNSLSLIIVGLVPPIILFALIIIKSSFDKKGDSAVSRQTNVSNAFRYFPMLVSSYPTGLRFEKDTNH